MFKRLTSKQLSRLKPCKLGRAKQWNVGDDKALLPQGKKLDMATCPPEAEVDYTKLPSRNEYDDHVLYSDSHGEEYLGPDPRKMDSSAYRSRGCCRSFQLTYDPVKSSICKFTHVLPRFSLDYSIRCSFFSSHGRTKLQRIVSFLTTQCEFASNFNYIIANQCPSASFC